MIGQTTQTFEMQIKFYLGEVFGKFGINLLGHLSLLELKRKRKPKRKDFFKEKSTHAHEMMHTHIRVFQTLALMHTCTLAHKNLIKSFGFS
jgi:hypothetical protein